jgi:hypothetical protein
MDQQQQQHLLSLTEEKCKRYEMDVFMLLSTIIMDKDNTRLLYKQKKGPKASFFIL